MRKVFARTQNVKNFISMMNNLEKRSDGVPGMALLYGEPGLGKTQAILWWEAQMMQCLSGIQILCREDGY